MTLSVNLRRLAALTALGALAACSSPPPPPPPTILQLTLTAAPDVNPDGTGKPSPIAIKLYQLAASGAFDKADYFALADKEAGVLGTDLAGRDALILAPGETKTLTIAAKPETKVLGITAGYRDIATATWRADVPVPANKTTPVKITAGANAIVAAPGS